MLQVLNRSRYSLHLGGGGFDTILSPGAKGEVPEEVWATLKDRPLYRSLVEAGHLAVTKGGQAKPKAPGVPEKRDPEERTEPIELDSFTKEFLDMHHTQAKALIEDLTDPDDLERLLAVETRKSVRDALIVQLKGLG